MGNTSCGNVSHPCLCLSSHEELSWDDEHLSCVKHLLVCILLLLILLLVLCFSYFIAVCFEQIDVSALSLCLCLSLTRGGARWREVAHWELNLQLVFKPPQPSIVQSFTPSSFPPQLHMVFHMLSMCYPLGDPGPAVLAVNPPSPLSILSLLTGGVEWGEEKPLTVQTLSNNHKQSLNYQHCFQQKSNT